MPKIGSINVLFKIIVRFDMATIAQRLEQKGIEKGIQLGEQNGLEKGMQLGEQKGRLDIAVKLLESGMSLQSVKEMTRLSEEKLAKIYH